MLRGPLSRVATPKLPQIAVSERGKAFQIDTGLSGSLACGMTGRLSFPSSPPRCPTYATGRE